MLILGPTGTGKSVHGNQIIALEQKYGGFTCVLTSEPAMQAAALLTEGSRKWSMTSYGGQYRLIPRRRTTAAERQMNCRSIQMRAHNRQANENASRGRIATLDANVAAVFLYDSLCSVQPEPKILTRWAGGEEWFKNPVVQGLQNSMPIVPDLNQD